MLSEYLSFLPLKCNANAQLFPEDKFCIELDNCSELSSLTDWWVIQLHCSIALSSNQQIESECYQEGLQMLHFRKLMLSWGLTNAFTLENECCHEGLQMLQFPVIVYSLSLPFSLVCCFHCTRISINKWIQKIADKGKTNSDTNKHFIHNFYQWQNKSIIIMCLADWCGQSWLKKVCLAKKKKKKNWHITNTDKSNPFVWMIWTKLCFSTMLV